MKPSQAFEADLLEFVTLMAGAQSFGVEIRQIREIRRWSPITPLPHAPSAVLGVINLRGTVVPILDLAARLGLGATADSARHVIIVVRIGDRTVGLLVASVAEIITVRRDQVRDLPTLSGFSAVECIQGLIELGEEMIRVLDLRAVLPPLDEASAA